METHGADAEAGGPSGARADGSADASPEARLKALGIELPVAPKPAANYVTATQSGRLVFLAGQGPLAGGQVVYRGKVGVDLTEEEGYAAARLTILNSLAILREHAGSLDRVTRIMKLLAWVNCAEGFQRQHLVLNGASDLLVQVFGERGRHARSAVSAHDLPFGIAVEIEMVAEVDFER
ncbi:MAG TPA: RidA family protein [Ramlibacter sp.]|uniref:RidA family protein n=1 Tax=Ramlibacter sp. TaxID=1917967 RepID=UPI002CC87AC2|nr:RidA family protein [Ramlibacter sp.]HVZ43908.1 RidA family protein [Ramlibacter sp.]